jgi:ribonuclease HII
LVCSTNSEAPRDLLSVERGLWARGIEWIAGIDEAGRGPLAGPVVAAAVVVAPGWAIAGVDDSKKLRAAERERLYASILDSSPAVAVGIAHHDEIDAINILQATFKAMHLAVCKLSVRPGHLLVDGNRFAECGIPFTTVVDGDALCYSIAAASIVAKVTRDRLMVEYDSAYPGYGFAKHKGYGTLEHRRAIARLGYCTIHRRTFAFRAP